MPEVCSHNISLADSCSAFVKEEVDPIEVLKAAIDGSLFDGSKDIARYRLYVARDEAGKIQSVYTGGMVGMADAAFPGEAMFMGAYGIKVSVRGLSENFTY